MSIAPNIQYTGRQLMRLICIYPIALLAAPRWEGIDAS